MMRERGGTDRPNGPPPSDSRRQTGVRRRGERKGDWTGESPLAHNGGDGEDDGGGVEKQGEGGADV